MCVHAVLFSSSLSLLQMNACVRTLHMLGLCQWGGAIMSHNMAVSSGYCLSLQAFGLAVLMARAGLAVPADAPVQVPAYSAVLADIGDEQSLSANLSTFSGHLRRIQVKPLLLFAHPCTFFCFVCCYWFSLCTSVL